MTPTDYIHKASLDAQGSITLLKESLTKELELMPKYTKSKQRQIEWVNTIQSDIATIFEYVDRLEEIIMRLEGCCLTHGIDTLTIKEFKSKPMIEVVTDTKRSTHGQYRLPLYLVEQFEPAEVKTATKPVLKWVNGVPDRKLRSTLPSVKEMIEGVGGL